MTHSIPDAMAVAATCDLGTVLITGDYKFDQTLGGRHPADMTRLAELGREGLLLLCGDSTNADRPASRPARPGVGPHLEDVFSRCEGRIIVTSFASNVHRVLQVVDAATALDRKVRPDRAVDAQERQHRVVPRPHRRAGGDARAGPRGRGLPRPPARDHSTGSQGEPLSALRRMAHPRPSAGAAPRGRHGRVLRHADPGQRAGGQRHDRPALPHRLRRDHGARRARARLGHGFAEEIKLMLNLTRPRYVMADATATSSASTCTPSRRVGGRPEREHLQGENGLPLRSTPTAPASASASTPAWCSWTAWTSATCGRPRCATAACSRPTHLHRRRDDLRAGRLVGRPARGDLPRRPVRGRGGQDRRGHPRGRRGLARPRRRGGGPRDRPPPADAPRRPSRVRLRPPAAAPDGACPSSSRSEAGSRTTNRAPLPRAGGRSIVTEPPWDSATARTIARPSPDEPPRSDAPRRSARTRGGRGRGRSPGVVLTLSTTSPFERASPAGTRVPSGVWRSAFSIRFSASRCSSSREPETTAGSDGPRRSGPRHRAQLGDGLQQHVAHVHGCVSGAALCVRARQQQEVGDEAAHALGGPQRRQRRRPLVAGQLVGEQLEVGEDAGQGVCGARGRRRRRTRAGGSGRPRSRSWGRRGRGASGRACGPARRPVVGLGERDASARVARALDLARRRP